MQSVLLAHEIQQVEQCFQLKLAEITPEVFRKKHKELLVKYHSDKFEKYNDTLIMELVREKHDAIELAAALIQKHLGQKSVSMSIDEMIRQNGAQFAFEKMKVEIVTKDKLFKYYLLETWDMKVYRGESVKIPNTEAKLIIQEQHSGISIGFSENVKLLLTFEVTDSVEMIANWLYEKTLGHASFLLVEGKKVEILYDSILHAIKRSAFKGLVAATNPEESV
ncbi:MAG: hypothetical protein ACKVTZ_12245 [Bacteroidia bacterium]